MMFIPAFDASLSALIAEKCVWGIGGFYNEGFIQASLFNCPKACRIEEINTPHGLLLKRK